MPETAFDMSDLPSSLPPAPAIRPVSATVSCRREKGKCLLVIDAAGLHEYLRTLEVPEGNGTFLDGPRDWSSSYINTGANTVASSALLKVGGPLEINLMEHYTHVPSAEVMRSLANSVDAVAHQIVDHYRPIEISVIIHSKPAKG